MSENALVHREAGKAVVVQDAGLAVVERLAAEGNADATIAKALGINRGTFARLLRDDGDDRVLAAYETGKARLADELTDILLSQARNGNTTAAIYLSKARLGWRDQGPATPALGSAVQVNITIPAPMSDAEFAKIVDVKEVQQ